MLNGKFVKAIENQRYWGFPKPRFNPVTGTMVPGFKILLDCNNKVPELKKEDTTRVPTDWANYMDPNAMTILLEDPICNIEEEEYWEACQHALKSPYELKANDEDEEGEQPLVMMRMEVMTRVIIVVIAVAVTMDMRMMTTAPIMRVIAAEIMIACTMAMIRVNPLVIEKIKM